MLQYEYLRNWTNVSGVHTYTARDTIIYALGVGVGLVEDAAKVNLGYVWEERLIAIPTMAAVLARDLALVSDPATGIDWKALLHGEQSIEFHKSLAVEGSVFGETSIEEVYDKGPERGALMTIKRVLYDAKDNQPIATSRTGAFLRANGGYGGKSNAPKPRVLPDRAPDFTVELQTRPEQALIYRMSGDLNPLHIDPDTAQKAGFPRPILHGLAMYGMAGLALIDSVGAGAPERLRRLDVRFSASLYPGEAMRLDVWRLHGGEVSYRCVSGERTILNNGYAVFSE